MEELLDAPCHVVAEEERHVGKVKPTELKLPGQPYDFVAERFFLRYLEEEGYELVKPIEGMCFVDGEWSTLEKADIPYVEYEPHLVYLEDKAVKPHEIDLYLIKSP